MIAYKKLDVWRKSHELTLGVYNLTKQFPKDETYGLTSQIRRASASISTNIVEGASYKSQKEFGRFLQIAIGSASEVEYQLELAKDLKYISEIQYKEFSEKIVIVRKMLISLSKSLKK